jgi:hypothetical protein
VEEVRPGAAKNRRGAAGVETRVDGDSSMRKYVKPLAAAVGGLIIACGLACAEHIDGYKDTPMLPGGKWHVHDPDRPQPKVIDPGTNSTQDVIGKPPSDAIVLFDGTDMSKWTGDHGQPSPWGVVNGDLLSLPKGYLYTKQRFGDCQLHVEFSEPTPPKGNSQGRGNSGVFFHDGTYEVQVLDCYNNKTYPDGQTAAIYGQFPPLVNACRPPGQWQSYDILFTAPRWDDTHKNLLSPAYFTVFHNGICVHNHTAAFGGTGHRISPHYSYHPVMGRIALQDHGNPVHFRNIWVRELHDYDYVEPTPDAAAPGGTAAPATPAPAAQK